LQTGIVVVASFLFAAYALLFIVWERLAAKERSTYQNIADSVATTIGGNQRRRGSISVTPEIEIIRDALSAAVLSPMMASPPPPLSPAVT
jgi:hypothetical protein